MDQRTIQIFFALLRSAIRGTEITEEERSFYSRDILEDLLKISFFHDVGHLLILGLKQNGLVLKEDVWTDKYFFKVIYRFEKICYEYEHLCVVLEKAQIPYIPLKGSVIRKYYPEEWMRTSCDIDILVHYEDLEKTISCLEGNLGYIKKERGTHDVSFETKTGVVVEIHFDLIEEERANNAIDVLGNVWKNVELNKNSVCKYEMSDAFFYFYHIAHMAKHFENGGCGIRPFIDLWILNHMNDVDVSEREKLLKAGRLMDFAKSMCVLSEVWFEGKEADDISLKIQNFLLRGGAYGSAGNRVALGEMKNGGIVKYVFSRIFVPYSKLKRYYPILVEHRWLTPVMQIRRWFMLLKSDVAQMAKNELKTSRKLLKSKSEEMNNFLKDIGLSER